MICFKKDISFEVVRIFYDPKRFVNGKGQREREQKEKEKDRDPV